MLIPMSPKEPTALSVFQRMTWAARIVVFNARAEVSRLGSERMLPEHLLLGLFGEGVRLRPSSGPGFRPGAHLVARLGLVPEQMGRILEEASAAVRGDAQLTTSAGVPLDEKAGEILLRALEEADKAESSEIQTHHVLCGILAVACRAAEILQGEGLELTAVREATKDLQDQRRQPSQGPEQALM
jgi:ATP-dependent Clp protease ATP-binding subunit ClpA